MSMLEEEWMKGSNNNDTKWRDWRVSATSLWVENEVKSAKRRRKGGKTPKQKWKIIRSTCGIFYFLKKRGKRKKKVEMEYEREKKSRKRNITKDCSGFCCLLFIMTIMDPQFQRFSFFESATARTADKWRAYGRLIMDQLAGKWRAYGRLKVGQLAGKWRAYGRLIVGLWRKNGGSMLD